MRGVTLHGDGAAIEVRITTARGTARLVTTRGKDDPRRLPDPRRALLLLRDLGIADARIDSRAWRPQDAAAERKPRPDRAKAMKAAHEALAYGDWLRARLARAAADPRAPLPHEQVMREMRERPQQLKPPREPKQAARHAAD